MNNEFPSAPSGGSGKKIAHPFGAELLCNGHQGERKCRCSKEEELICCFDLSERPLPRLGLEDGVFGTSKVKQWFKFDRIGESEKLSRIVLAAFTLVTLGVFLGISYADFGWEVDGNSPVKFSCTSRYWSNNSRIDDGCGLDGMDCRPLESGFFVGRCPKTCLTDWSKPVVGDGIYTATSRVCASAIHAGVIRNNRGGCFRVRLAGEQPFFNGTSQNGVTSTSLGWFPRTMQFEKLPESEAKCNIVRPFMDFFVAFAVFLLAVILRPSGGFAITYISVAGYLYLAMGRFQGSANFAHVLNSPSTRLLIILLFLSFLWPVAGRGTLPEPRKFPLDFFIFYFLPFWMGIRMNVILNSGLTLTFTAEAFSEPGGIFGFILFFAIGIPLVAFQFALFQKARMLRQIASYVIIVLIFVVIFTLSTLDFLSLHVHHYMVGGIGFLLFQGQPKLRYSIIVQGLMLGVLVNGVTVWDVAPLYDNTLPSGGGGSPNQVFWSGLNISGSMVSLEWATPDTIELWNCTDAGFKEFLDLVENNTNFTLLEPGPSPMNTSASDADFEADDESLILQPDSFPQFRISANGVILSDHFYSDNETAFSETLDLGVPGSIFQLSVGNDRSTPSPYLYVQIPDLSMEEVLGGGYYDATANYFKTDLCNRVYALLLQSKNVTAS